MNEERVWVLYDGRALDGAGTADAAVLTVCRSEGEARRECRNWSEAAVYSYRQEGIEFHDERYEFGHIPKKRKRKHQKPKKPKPKRPWRKT